MSYNSHYKNMSVSTALEIYLSTEEFHGIDFANTEYEITEIAENDFRIQSAYADPFDYFDFSLRIYIDPVCCQITYDIYRTAYGDTGKLVIDDISYESKIGRASCRERV